MKNLFDEVIDELLNQDKEILPLDNMKENRKQLEITSQLGRSAIELENSKAFQDLIPPFTKKTIKDCLGEIITRGIQMPKEEMNVLVASMQSALKIYALIKDKKKEATEANKILNKEREIIKRREAKEREFKKGEKARQKVIEKETKKLERKVKK